MSTNTIQWVPGGRRNKSVEIEAGLLEESSYEFSLCNRQEETDPYLYRLFIYRPESLGGGYLHLGGFNFINSAKKHAELILYFFE